MVASDEYDISELCSGILSSDPSVRLGLQDIQRNLLLNKAGRTLHKTILRPVSRATVALSNVQSAKAVPVTMGASRSPLSRWPSDTSHPGAPMMTYMEETEAGPCVKLTATSNIFSAVTSTCA